MCMNQHCKRLVIITSCKHVQIKKLEKMTLDKVIRRREMSHVAECDVWGGRTGDLGMRSLRAKAQRKAGP